MITYLTAFALFGAIYAIKVRSLVSGTAVLFLGILLSLELLRETESEVKRTWLYAGITGLILGELTWALNYWVIGGLVGGAFLLLVFYILTGIIQHHFVGRLNRRLMYEYAMVMAIGFVFTLTASFWFRAG